MGKHLYPSVSHATISIFPQPTTPIKTDNSAAKGIFTATVIQKGPISTDLRFYLMKYRVKLKDLFVYWEPWNQNTGGYFKQTKKPTHHHREIRAAYCYMGNALLKINHKVVQEWSYSVLTPNHKFLLTPNHTVVQGCAITVRTYGHTKTTYVMT